MHGYMEGNPGTVTDGSKTDPKESDKARKLCKKKEICCLLVVA